MATPPADAETGGAHGAAEPHHLSRAPIIVAVGAFLFYVGAAFEVPNWGLTLGDAQVVPVPLFLPLGVLVLLWGFLVWAGEAVEDWRAGHEVPGALPGRHVGWWGTIFFLATEVMLFGGLFAAFFYLRGLHPETWAEARVHLDAALPLVSINTVILLTSGVTMHYAVHRVREGAREGVVRGLLATLLLGAIFLGLQVSEYQSLMHEGITLGGDAFGSIFYLTTGTHGLHVLLGLVMIAIATWRAHRGLYSPDRHVSLEGFALYWHFVDVVWLFLYLVIYLGAV